LEHAKSEIIYIPLQDEIKSKIQVTTEIVGDTYDDNEAATHVEKLNGDLIEAKLTGEMVQLFSSSMIWTSEKIGETGVIIESIYDPELLKKLSVTGVFSGVGEMILNEQRILVYQLSVGFDDETMTSRSVIAPVDESTLLIGTVGSVEAEISEILTTSIRQLATIENPKFQETLRDLLDLFEAGDGINATFMRELGILATWLLAQDGVHDDIEMRRAIGAILTTVVENDDATYKIAAQEYILSTDGIARIDSVRPFEEVTEVHGIAMVNDYDISKDGTLIFENTLQPSIVITQTNGEQRYVPLKSILQYENIALDNNCRSSMLRFLAQHPNFMKSD